MKVYHTNEQLDRERLESCPWSFQSRSWDGDELVVPLQWRVAYDPDHLWFMASVPGKAWFNAALGRGQFFEGLWEQDVAELFVMTDRGLYQEFNVSPSGAWWSCRFSAYRVRQQESTVPSGASTEVLVDEASWQALLSIPRRELLASPSEITAMHVAAIVHTPTLRYLSSAPVTGEQADFHRRECFTPVELDPLNR
jgi:hypothetical protein